MCRGVDAGGSVELCNMQSLICNVSEYVEELWRCIGDVSEKCGVQYAGSYSDNAEDWAQEASKWKKLLQRKKAVSHVQR